jgi:mRNA interferase HigB
MWVISKAKLRESWEQHADAEVRLRAWYQVVSEASWRDWDDLRRTFPSADRVGRLTVFNIGGNRYRLVARVEYERHKVYVRRVMTHGEYDTNEWKHDPWY